jgi:hypothetical protein
MAYDASNPAIGVILKKIYDVASILGAGSSNRPSGN